MDDNTTDLDQTDEETLAHEVSDEALEAAAGRGRPRPWGLVLVGCLAVASAD